MELLPVIIVVGILIIIGLGSLRAAYDWVTGKKEVGAFICATCGSRGTPKATTRGSILIEIILWLCFIIPGLIYSIWRLTTRYNACPTCGSKDMIPVNSPTGKRLVEQNKPA